MASPRKANEISNRVVGVTQTIFTLDFSFLFSSLFSFQLVTRIVSQRIPNPPTEYINEKSGANKKFRIFTRGDGNFGNSSVFGGMTKPLSVIIQILSVLSVAIPLIFFIT